MALSEFYRDLTQQLEALLADESDPLANTANTAALLFGAMDKVNWVGFYFLRPADGGVELVVGPFQGKTACTRIALGRGVCGTAAQRRETVVVSDVHKFPGHIACDAASQSEIVVPIIDSDKLVGVLDIDSPITERFDRNDQAGLEEVVAILVRETSFNPPA